MGNLCSRTAHEVGYKNGHRVLRKARRSRHSRPAPESADAIPAQAADTAAVHRESEAALESVLEPRPVYCPQSLSPALDDTGNSTLRQAHREGQQGPLAEEGQVMVIQAPTLGRPVINPQVANLPLEPQARTHFSSQFSQQDEPTSPQNGTPKAGATTVTGDKTSAVQQSDRRPS